MTETTTTQIWIVFLSLIMLAGTVLLIMSIRKFIKFSRALKHFREELPEMMKEGLIDYDKIKNSKLPDVF